MAALALAAGFLLPAPARAITVICSFSGSSPGFRVARVVVNDTVKGAFLGLSADPGSSPIGRGGGWNAVAGITVLGEDRLTPHYAFAVAGFGTRNRIVATHPLASNQRVVDEEFPSVRVPQQVSWVPTRWGYFWEGNPVAQLPAGTYYVVAWGWGGGSFSASFESNNDVSTCTHLAAQGDVVTFDHTDFNNAGTNANITQSSHYHVPGAGVGGAISASFPVAAPLDRFAGIASWRAYGARWGGSPRAQDFNQNAQMELALPSGTRAFNHTDIRPVVDRAGTYTFKLNYQGAAPDVIVTGVRYRLL